MYVSHFKYLGMVSKLTRKPENKIVGIADTGPKNIPQIMNYITENLP